MVFDSITKTRESLAGLLELAGHVLERDEGGEIYWLAMSVGHHNGPQCTVCGRSWCEHCEWRIDKCVKKGGE